MSRWHEEYRFHRWMHTHADAIIAVALFLILAVICGAAYLIDGVK